MRQKAKVPAQSSGKRSLQRGCGRRVPFVIYGPLRGPLTGDFMFPDLARDDVFRLETPRLWLRWPRICDAAAIHNFAADGSARYTARILIPILKARLRSSTRRAKPTRPRHDFAMTPSEAKATPLGDQPRIAWHGALALGFALALGGGVRDLRPRRRKVIDEPSADAHSRDPSQRQG
jgi:hypothetical protein